MYWHPLLYEPLRQTNENTFNLFFEMRLNSALTLKYFFIVFQKKITFSIIRISHFCSNAFVFLITFCISFFVISLRPSALDWAIRSKELLMSSTVKLSGCKKMQNYYHHFSGIQGLPYKIRTPSKNNKKIYILSKNRNSFSWFCVTVKKKSPILLYVKTGNVRKRTHS